MMVAALRLREAAWRRFLAARNGHNEETISPARVLHHPATQFRKRALVPLDLIKNSEIPPSPPNWKLFRRIQPHC